MSWKNVPLACSETRILGTIMWYTLLWLAGHVLLIAVLPRGNPGGNIQTPESLIIAWIKDSRCVYYTDWPRRGREGRGDIWPQVLHDAPTWHTLSAIGWLHCNPFRVIAFLLFSDALETYTLSNNLPSTLAPLLHCLLTTHFRVLPQYSKGILE